MSHRQAFNVINQQRNEWIWVDATTSLLTQLSPLEMHESSTLSVDKLWMASQTGPFGVASKTGTAGANGPWPSRRKASVRPDCSLSCEIWYGAGRI